MIAGSDDALGLIYAASVLETAQEEPKPLPPIPLLYDDDENLIEAIISFPANAVFAKLGTPVVWGDVYSQEFIISLMITVR